MTSLKIRLAVGMLLRTILLSRWQELQILKSMFSRVSHPYSDNTMTCSNRMKKQYMAATIVV